MGNRTRIMPMGVLPLCICMYVCLHACVLCLPNDEPTVEECTECKVSLSEEDPSGLTERDVRNLLRRYRLAYSKDIKEIKFLRAVITLSDPKVAAKIAQRQTVIYRGKILKFELNSTATRVPDLQRPTEQSPKPTYPTLTFAETTNTGDRPDLQRPTTEQSPKPTYPTLTFPEPSNSAGDRLNVGLLSGTVAAKIAQRQTVNYRGKILKFELNSIATRVPNLQRPTEQSPKPTYPTLTFAEPTNTGDPPDLQRPTEESPKPTYPTLTFPEPTYGGDRLKVALLSGTVAARFARRGKVNFRGKILDWN